MLKIKILETICNSDNFKQLVNFLKNFYDAFVLDILK